MYKRLYKEESKRYYNRILNETIEIVEECLKQNFSPIYNVIYSQLLDIKKNIVEKAVFTNSDDINDRYTLGSIAVHNFDDNNEMQERLIDIFSGACDYHLLEE